MDLAFVKVIDETIFVVDAIIMFLQLEIKDIAMPILDIAKLLADAVVGMLIIAMQEIIFTLRDTAIAWVIESLEKATINDEWIKCFQFQDFIQILKKYIHE